MTTGAGRLVVAVDDEPSIRKLLELTLTAADFAVLSFEGPQSALTELRSGLHPDVIISDISMPRMDGFAFCEAVRAMGQLRGVPFLFLTALNERAHMRQGMALGADDYLTKPFDRRELIGAVEGRIARFAEIRKPASGSLRVCGFGAPMVEKSGARLDWDSSKRSSCFFICSSTAAARPPSRSPRRSGPVKPKPRRAVRFTPRSTVCVKRSGVRSFSPPTAATICTAPLRSSTTLTATAPWPPKPAASAALTDFAHAADLYHADFFLGTDSAWAEDVRLDLHASHLELLVSAAESAAESGHYETATRFYSAITEHEPYSESAWRFSPSCGSGAGTRRGPPKSERAFRNA